MEYVWIQNTFAYTYSISQIKYLLLAWCLYIHTARLQGASDSGSSILLLRLTAALRWKEKVSTYSKCPGQTLFVKVRSIYSSSSYMDPSDHSNPCTCANIFILWIFFQSAGVPEKCGTQILSLPTSSDIWKLYPNSFIITLSKKLAKDSSVVYYYTLVGSSHPCLHLYAVLMLPLSLSPNTQCHKWVLEYIKRWLTVMKGILHSAINIQYILWESKSFSLVQSSKFSPSRKKYSFTFKDLAKVFSGHGNTHRKLWE